MSKFEDTRWSLIFRAASSDPQVRNVAWQEFYYAYREPLLWYAGHWASGENEAEDLLQSFFAKVAEKNWLEDANQAGAKLRTFLLVRLQRHLNDIHKHDSAQKRGGKWQKLFLSEIDSRPDLMLPFPDESIQREFDRRWAEAVLDRALTRLRERAEQRGNLEVFELLKNQLARDSPKRLSQLSIELGKSEGALRMILQRQRENLRKFLREEIAETLSPDVDLEEEFRYLTQVLE